MLPILSTSPTPIPLFQSFLCRAALISAVAIAILTTATILSSSQQQMALTMNGTLQSVLSYRISSLALSTCITMSFLCAVACVILLFRYKNPQVTPPPFNNPSLKNESNISTTTTTMDKNTVYKTLPIKKIEAPVLGRITKILVSQGDKVSLATPLCILEIMKVEIAVSANFEGKIKNIFIQPNEIVQRGQVLIDMEEESSIK